jgi:transcriptional regulator with XRE-family HTH domain
MSDLISKRVGTALRAIRVARGVTQEDLARLLGVDRVTISRYEAGTRPMTIPTLLHLATFLDVPPNDLLAGISAQTQQETAHETSIQTLDMRWIIRTLLAHPTLVGIVKAFLQTYVTADPEEQAIRKRG